MGPVADGEFAFDAEQRDGDKYNSLRLEAVELFTRWLRTSLQGPQLVY